MLLIFIICGCVVVGTAFEAVVNWIDGTAYKLKVWTCIGWIYGMIIAGFLIVAAVEVFRKMFL